MKKVALSLIALLAVGTFAFAEDTAAEKAAGVSVSLTADASAAWGFDLDTKVHGFSNGFNTDLTLTFVPEADSSKTGTGDVYGSILIEDISVEVDQEDKVYSKWGTDKTDAGEDTDSDSKLISIGDITAKIVFPNGYIKLFENTDPKASYAVDDDDDNGGASIVADDTFYKYSGKYMGSDAEWSLGADNTEYSAFAGTGISANYTVPAVVSITGGIASNGGLDQAQQGGYEGQIALGLLAVEKLTLEGKFYTAKSTDALNAVGGTLAYDLGVAVPFANVDYDLTNSKYYADFGAKLPLVDGLNTVVAGEYNDKKVLSYTVTAVLAKDKLAGPLSASVGFRQFDLSKEVDKDGYGEVFAKVGLAATDVVALSGTVNAYNKSLFAKASIEYTGIALSTIGVYWKSSDLGEDKTTGDSKLGKLYLQAKVAY